MCYSSLIVLGEKKKMMPGSTSLYSCVKSNVRDRVWCSREKGWLYHFARQIREATVDSGTQTMCPHLGKIVRSFILTVQRGRDQLVNTLLMVCGEINRVHVVSLQVPLAWGLHACGQYSIDYYNFSQLKGFQYL